MRALITVLLVLWVGFASAQDTISVTENQISDTQITQRLQDILGQLDEFQDVHAEVHEGVVKLTGTTTSLTDVARLDDLAGRIDGVVAVKNQVMETSDIVRRLDPAIERFNARMTRLLTTLPIVLIALAAAVLVSLIGVLLARLKNPWERLAPNSFIADIYRHILRLVFLGAGVIIALDILNATALLSTIMGAAGIVGLAVGFAIRDTVENFIASILLSIRHPFEPSDWIDIGGDSGKVIRLTSRATILLSAQGNQIRIPNATVFKARIVNYSRNPERRFDFEMGIDPRADLGAMRALAEKTIESLPFVLKSPGPNVWIDRIGEGAVTMIMTGWIDQTDTDLLRARGEALRQVKAAIEGAGVQVPNTAYVFNLQDDDESAPRPAGARARLRTDDVSAHEQEELERIVDEERRESDNTDLLEKDAPRE